MKLFVEGGGDAGDLQTACRKGFTAFITKAGITRRPRVVACGSRQNAYESFRTAVEKGEAAMLLVDSEAPIAAEHQAGPADDWHPWRHLKARPGDGWDLPAGAKDRHCQLMVECMESWFIADAGSLAAYFGQGFAPNALPRRRDSEAISKATIFGALAEATKACKTKAAYGKGAHSFEILARIDPAPVMAASPWARRFIDALRILP